jgi:nitrilase
VSASSGVKVAAAQLGSVLFDSSATLLKVERACREAAASGVRLLVFPEALIGGYPKGSDFGAAVGIRSEAGRDLFRRYFDSAIACPSVETEQLAAWADEFGLHIIIGAVEREGGTLYCATLMFVPGRGLAFKHRKLMPTASERLIWGFGDGSTMGVVETSVGRIASAICWEHYMPMFRQFLYAGGVQIWCASTVDEREMWRISMRHIAYEGRCFVISACQFFTRADCPPDFEPARRNSDGVLIHGGSMIVAPSGAMVAGPLEGREGLVCAEIDLDEIARGKFDLDVAGHYARPDVFRLTVDVSAKPVVAHVNGPATRSADEQQPAAEVIR